MFECFKVYFFYSQKELFLDSDKYLYYTNPNRKKSDLKLQGHIKTGNGEERERESGDLVYSTMKAVKLEKKTI